MNLRPQGLCLLSDQRDLEVGGAVLLRVEPAAVDIARRLTNPGIARAELRRWHALEIWHACRRLVPQRAIFCVDDHLRREPGVIVHAAHGYVHYPRTR